MHLEAQLLPEIHRKLGVERAHWFGQSDGSSIALIGAASFPNLAASLMLEAPHVFVEKITVSSIAEIGKIYDQSTWASACAAITWMLIISLVNRTISGWNPHSFEWNIEELLPSILDTDLVDSGAGR